MFTAMQPFYPAIWPPVATAQVKTHATVESNDLVAEPTLDTHVFCSILDDAGEVRLGE